MELIKAFLSQLTPALPLVVALTRVLGFLPSNVFSMDMRPPDSSLVRCTDRVPSVSPRDLRRAVNWWAFLVRSTRDRIRSLTLP